MLLAVAAFVLTPVRAYAGTYEVPHVAIDAVVQPDGSMRVTETRTFEFEDDVNGVYWEIPAGANQQGYASTIEVAGVSALAGAGSIEGAAPYAFTRAATAASGEDGVYTVANGVEGTTVKVFSPREDGEVVSYTVDYVLYGAVMSWQDTAELYWKFVGADWEEPSQDVRLTVSFAGVAASGVAPVAEGDAANLRAWGHGPLDGSVSLDAATEGLVTYTTPTVEPGQFAEARIAFPTAWVPQFTVPASAAGIERLPQIRDEEQQWADEANAQREQARLMLGAVTALQIVVPALLFGGLLALKLTRGRNPKPVFEETYFRDVPSADHPAVIATFMEDGTVPNGAFVATLMKLTDERVIGMEKETVEEKKLFGTKEVERYRLLLLDGIRATDPIDRAVLDLYFGVGEDAQIAVEFDELRSRAKHDSKAHNERLSDYRAEVTAELERRGYVRSDGKLLKGTTVGLATLLGIGSLVLFMMVDSPNIGVLLFSEALLIASAVLAMTYRVYSREGVELRARCTALKRWLEDFTNLDEAVPSDLILWNKLLVMAVALGVSDEVLRQLADAVPRELRENEETGGYWFPVYWWCYPHGHLGAPASELHGSYAASVSELASSVSSSGGGFGGGFSGGGGGGVGGGGGGTF